MATTTLATVPSRSVGPGQFNSGDFVVPNTQFSTITISFTILAADLADATKSLTFSLLKKQPDASYSFDAGFTWQGGNLNAKTGTFTSPALSVDIADLIGQTIQIEADVPVALTTSITVTAK